MVYHWVVQGVRADVAPEAVQADGVVGRASSGELEDRRDDVQGRVGGDHLQGLAYGLPRTHPVRVVEIDVRAFRVA